MTEYQQTSDPKLGLVLSRLKRVKRVRSGSDVQEGTRGAHYMALCPAHEDKNPSLSIREGRDWINLHCWAGCEWRAVVSAIGLQPKELALRDSNGWTHAPVKKRVDKRLMELESKMACEYLQGDDALLGRLLGERGWTPEALRMLGVGTNAKPQHMLTLPVFDKVGRLHDVLRYDPFLRKGRKVLAGEGRSRMPFPAPESLTANGHPLFIVEGEGTAISLRSIGINAVGLPGSIGKPKGDPQNPGRWRGVGWHESWRHRFDGHNRLVLMPDCDDQGRALMYNVQYSLSAAGFNTALLDLRARKEGFDVADLLAVAKTREDRDNAKMLLLMAATTARQQPDKVEDALVVLRAWFAEGFNA